MRSKLFTAVVAALSMGVFASPSLAARHHLSREAAMQRCNELVMQHRNMSMSGDTQRSAAWKACMHKLGYRP